MNPELERQMKEADAVMAEHGEAQPADTDGRALTSAANGQNGGRKPIDWGAIAEAYQVHYDTKVRWYKGEFYEYDRKRGAYRRTTEREQGARMGAFLLSPDSSVLYSVNGEKNALGALRATRDLTLAPPCFADTGQSAAGWVAMQNGLLDVEAAARGMADALHPHTPDFFSTAFLPYEWTPGAECPRFERFVADVLPDPEAREMAQMLAGLLLVPETCYNVFFVLLGDGGCGKSTFLKVLAAMLGEANVCSVPLAMMAEKHTMQRLTRYLANLVDDSPTADATSHGHSIADVEGVLKKTTEGAPLHVEPKGVDAWDAPATARCVFCQNPPLPHFVDRSAALWDRVRIIPFPRRFRGTAEQNPHLAREIIAEELPGVFAWAVRGLGALRELTQFPQCADGAKVIAEHKEICDREAAFLADRYIYAAGVFTASAEIYTAYRSWCDAEGYRPKSAANFAQDVQRVFRGRVEWTRRYVGGKQVRGFLNIAATPEYAADE